MAYIADVQNAIVSSIAGALFPTINYRNGDLQVSAAGPQVRLYPGWPTSALLDEDLAMGVVGENGISAFAVHVTVFPAATMARNTTRYLADWVEAAPVITSSFTSTVSNRTVTFGGSYMANSVVGVAYGNGVNPAAYCYRLLATDTPTTVASVFATKFPTASLNGSTITFPDDQALVTNVLVDGQALLETRRQEQYFRITIWAPTPAARDIVGSFVDSALSGVRAFQLADGSLTGHPEYRSIFVDDVPEKSREFRADMQLCIEYPTTLLQLYPRLMFGDIKMTPNAGSLTLNFGVSLIT